MLCRQRGVHARHFAIIHGRICLRLLYLIVDVVLAVWIRGIQHARDRRDVDSKSVTFPNCHVA